VVCDEMLDLAQVAASDGGKLFADQVGRYWHLLDMHRLLTFSRMIRLCAEYLARNPDVLQVEHLIVDEYQDINRAQESLISVIIDRRELRGCMVVGDPRQCIYEWRGSDPECFERFASARSAETRELLENRRSGSEIVKVANTVAQRFSDPALRCNMTPMRSETGLATYRQEASPDLEAEWVADQIQRIAGAGGLQCRDVAVLLRSVSTSGSAFTKAFERRGILYLVGGKIGLFKRGEAAAMGALWMWFADRDWWMGYNTTVKAADLLNRARDWWPGRFDAAMIGEFKQLLLAGRFRNLTEAYQELLLRLGYLDWNPDDSLQAVHIANLGRFSHLLLDYEAAVWRGGRRVGWTALLRGLAWFVQSYGQSGYAEQVPDELPDVDAVQITTIHQAKGLEWPLVFVPALTSKRFPSSNTGKSQDWLLDRSLFDAERYEGGLESERRLFFVAVTRARDILVLSRHTAIKNGVGPSLFLSEVGVVPACRTSLAGGAAQSARGNDDTVTTLTIQDIMSYLRCPHEYRMRTVWGYEPELVRELGFGRSVHHILRVLGEAAKEGKDPLAILSTVVAQHFFLPYETPQAMASIRPNVEKAIRAYLQRYRGMLSQIEEVETRLEFPLDRHATLVGRADVVLSDSGSCEVIDYKTADDARVDEEAELQVQLYSLGLVETGRPVTNARIMHVLDEDSSERRVLVDDVHLKEARGKAERCVEGITKREFRAAAGVHCGTCDVRRICRYAPGRRKAATQGIRT
jgi:DNA helicase-2/ATP-dependent DNA helicase PcrA